jgi:hypothetical protein
MEDVTFDQLDTKLRSIMQNNISLELCIVLEKIIDNSMHQTNNQYYTALEQFEKEHLLPILN